VVQLRYGQNCSIELGDWCAETYFERETQDNVLSTQTRAVGKASGRVRERYSDLGKDEK